MDIRTILAHAGICSDKKTGAISTPIYQTATFRHEALGKSTGYDYSRTANPTRDELEKIVACLEGGARGCAFSSGMAAVTAVASLFSQGDHILLSDDLYGGTYRLFEKIARRFGIVSSFVNISDIDAVKKEISKETRAIFFETPSNPMMKIADISAISFLAKEKGILCIVDNTFMSPYLQQPIKLGADIVIHSGSKFLGGHNDVLCGIAVCSSAELGEKLAFIQNATGGVLSPFDSWLMLRGLKTLSVRVERSESNTQKIVEWMQKQNDITDVYYPGIETSDGFAVQKKQAKGFGSIISFKVKNIKAAERIINNVKLVSFAESLGGVESLITYPLLQTHSDVPAEIREYLGITDRLLRLSVGIESADDIIDDLKQALKEQ